MTNEDEDDVVRLHPALEFQMRRIVMDQVGGVIPPSHGGGGGGEGIEPRVARLESDVAHILSNVADIKLDVRDIKNDARSDFKWILGGGLTATVALLGVMAKGFGWIGGG